ncbi:MAG: hypothetical protein ACYDIA_17450 [Candidatus Humimicrobiaceae bacterium]
MKEKPIKVTESYQMLGEIDEELDDYLEIDTANYFFHSTFFGYKNADWKEWTLFDGTPVLVPGSFNTEPDENGDILNYPGGDKSCKPCAKMPKKGFYFDSIIRQHEIDDNNLNVEDNLEEYSIFSDEYLQYLQNYTKYLRCSWPKVLWEKGQ